VGHREGYRLTVGERGVVIEAREAAGAFYGAQTFAQLVRQFGGRVPGVVVEDWPDLEVRGYMQDISRDKVPTMETLYALVDQLAALKYNQLQLYTEHTFAYSGHREVWAQADPMTGEQILELERYCAERFIELVPNQNSFGHMERWLKWPRYEGMAECPEGFVFPWGIRHPTGFSLDPLDPRSLELVEELFDELLPHFSSGLFNVGCDETFDLGMGKSKEACERRGKERVYLEFVLKIYEMVKKRGRRMQFWGDIILHRPELIPELPKDLIALNWGYDVGHPFEKETGAFAASGVPFYVCPGTSSWCSIGGRTENCVTNLKSAAEWGVKNGAAGYLNTDWGDIGHLQYLPASYVGIVAGGAYSWCLESNRELDVAGVLDLHVFRDRAGVMGRVAVDVGNVYLAANTPLANGTRYFWAFVGNADRKKLYQDVTVEEWGKYERAMEEAIAPLDGARMERGDAGVIVEEWRNAGRMIRHGCRRGRWMLDQSLGRKDELGVEMREIVGHHRRLWLARNRVGGVQDSTGRLELRLAEYR
jgi:hypothetical protein